MRVLRVLMRLSRIVKLVAFTERLVLLVESFVVGMSSAFWVMILLLLALYIFAVLAKELFGDNAAQFQGGLDAAGVDLPMEAPDPHPNPNPNWAHNVGVLGIGSQVHHHARAAVLS